jgi:hypothetical protein
VQTAAEACRYRSGSITETHYGGFARSSGQIGQCRPERNLVAERLILTGAPERTAAVARCDWEVRMRSVSFLAAAVIGVSALAAACGQQPAGSASGSSGSPAPSTGPPAAAVCGDATPTSPPDRTLTLSASDNGRSFCIKPGTGVLIYLRGTSAVKWAVLKSSSAAMVPRANGHLILALGVTGGYFVAAQPGVAAITSARSPCGPHTTPNPSPGPATPHQNKKYCGVIQTFRVTVRVAR